MYLQLYWPRKQEFDKIPNPCRLVLDPTRLSYRKIYQLWLIQRYWQSLKKKHGMQTMQHASRDSRSFTNFYMAANAAISHILACSDKPIPLESSRKPHVDLYRRYLYRLRCKCLFWQVAASVFDITVAVFDLMHLDDKWQQEYPVVE